MKKLSEEMVRSLVKESPNWNNSESMEFQFEGWDIEFFKDQDNSEYCMHGIRKDKKCEREFTSWFDSPEEAVLFLLNDFGTTKRFSNWENAVLRHEAFKEYFSRLAFSYYDEEYEETTLYYYIVNGDLTAEQQETIISCLDDGQFVPDDVGIDNGEWGKWHELEGFDRVSECPGDAMTPEELVESFQKMYAGWHDATSDVSDKRPYLVEVVDRVTQMSLVWAESRGEAEEKAEELMNQKAITFSGDTLHECSAEAQHIATAEDVRNMRNY